VQSSKNNKPLSEIERRNIKKETLQKTRKNKQQVRERRKR